jgi:hypothetical protein
MAETYTDQSYAVLGEGFAGEVDEFEDPGVVVEGVVFYSSPKQHPFDQPPSVMPISLESSTWVGVRWEGLTASRQKHSIHLLEFGVEFVVHDVVLCDVQFWSRGSILFRDFVRAFVQQLFEEVAVAAVLFFRAADGRVALEDGEAEGRAGHVEGRIARLE